MAGQAKNTDKEFFIRIPERGILIKMSTINIGSALSASEGAKRTPLLAGQACGKFNSSNTPFFHLIMSIKIAIFIFKMIFF